MAAPKRDNEKAARVLAEWAMSHFREAKIPELSATYDISERTLWNWRKEVSTNKQLALLYESRLNDLLNQDWKSELGETLTAGIRRMRELINTSESLTAVTDAVSTLVDIELTSDTLRREANAINSGTGRGTAETGTPVNDPASKAAYSTAN